MSNEPVVTKDAAQAALVTLIGGVAAVTAAFGWWNPTAPQIIAIGSAGAGVWSFLSLVASFRVRAKVTPVAPTPPTGV